MVPVSIFELLIRVKGLVGPWKVFRAANLSKGLVGAWGFDRQNPVTGYLIYSRVASRVFHLVILRADKNRNRG